MNDWILVQYCPLDKSIGRYATCDKNCDNFLNEFLETCRASDPYCKYIVMILENQNCKTPYEIKEACKETIRIIHRI